MKLSTVRDILLQTPPKERIDVFCTLRPLLKGETFWDTLRILLETMPDQEYHFDILCSLLAAREEGRFNMMTPTEQEKTFETPPDKHLYRIAHDEELHSRQLGMYWASTMEEAWRIGDLEFPNDPDAALYFCSIRKSSLFDTVFLSSIYGGVYVYPTSELNYRLRRKLDFRLTCLAELS